jgi:nicotinate-nucleotide pyrophosphorylase (carboxylating)
MPTCECNASENWPVPAALVRRVVARALEEDLGPGDLTTLACVPAAARATGVLLAKQAGVVAGLYVAGEVFRQLDPQVRWEPLLEEGAAFESGQILARVAGQARALLSGERVALNFLQRLSGIATLTRAYVQALAGTRCRLLDTRKTTPGLRALEKAAVRAGGGHNHRFALYDGYLIKDNHIIAAGGLRAAVAAARQAAAPTAAIEVEVQNFDQLAEALEAGADVIMLDNFSPQEVAVAVARVAGRARLEASGSITLAAARAYAQAGVDFISVGALTHSAPVINISLELESHAAAAS